MAKKPPYDERVAEAVGVLRGLTAANRFGDMRDERPSCKGMRMLACRNAGLKLGEDEALSKRLEGIDLGEHVQHFVGEIMRRLAAVRPEHGAMLDPPTRNFGALWRLPTTEQHARQTGLITECLTAGTNPLQMVAVAVYRATLASPDSFGAIDNLEEHHKAMAQARTRLEKLCADLDGWEIEDVIVREIPKSDTCRLFFRLDDTVSAIPRAGSGRRLVEHLAAAQAAKAA